MLRIGMLTSGGDCQSLNAAMRGVVKGICNKRKDVEIYGFKDGYKGLIYSDFNMLTSKDFSGILTQGGTILGTSRQPFKLMRVPDKDGIDKVEAMKHTYHKLHLDCLVILGGNGTHKTANLLREEGLNVVTLPKTIDNDLWGTDMTFGFQSAVDIATDTIDRIHTTATSHSRAVAEGAISKEDAKLKKKEYKEKLANRKYPSIAYELAEQIGKETDKEVRITVPGHTQRGGTPCSYDRVFATRVGAKAAELILNEEYGYMVAMRNGETVKVPLEEVAGKLKYVDPNCGLIKEARTIGISFGDEV